MIRLGNKKTGKYGYKYGYIDKTGKVVLCHPQDKAFWEKQNAGY